MQQLVVLCWYDRSVVQRPSELARDDEWAQHYYTSPFYVFGRLQSPNVLVLRRTGLRYPDLSDVERETAQLLERFPAARLSRLLIDMRDAPPTNDPAFELAMRGLRCQVALRVDLAVLLVATASGAMQVTRLQRAEGTSFLTTRNAHEALQLVSE